MDMQNMTYLSRKNNVRQAVDENDIGIELSIFPGFAVPSAYDNKEVNEISLYVIRMAVAMTVIQVGLSVLTMLTLNTAAVVLSLLSIMFYMLVLRYAIRTVKKMNKETGTLVRIERSFPPPATKTLSRQTTHDSLRISFIPFSSVPKGGSISD